MLTKLKNGLDGTQLKTIALVLMVLDHIHYFFEFTGCIPTVFSMLGRLSAPLFLFCTVEGFAHTHDRRRYFIRIWAIGTAMAALEFFMIYAKAFRRGDGFYPLNAIFQDLMLLCIVWQGIDWLREKKFAKGIAAIAAVLCWPFVMVAFLSAFPRSSRCRGLPRWWRLSSPARCPCGPASQTAAGAFCWAVRCCMHCVDGAKCS